MANTILELLGKSTPVSETVARKLGLVKAAIACRVLFYEQLDDRVCRATNKSFQRALGISAGTVSTNLHWLLENGWIRNTKPLVKGNQPNHFKVTQKFYDLLQRSGDERDVQEMNVDVQEMNVDVQEMNVDVQEMNGKEDIKEDSKEEIKEIYIKPEKNFGNDPMTDVFNGQGQTSEATAPQPADQWLAYRDEFLRIFKEFKNAPLSIPEKNDLASFQEKYPDDTPEDFAKLINECRTNFTGNGRCSWKRILDVRQAGGTWAAWIKTLPEKDGHNGYQQQSGITGLREKGKHVRKLARKNEAGEYENYWWDFKNKCEVPEPV